MTTSSLQTGPCPPAQPLSFSFFLNNNNDDDDDDAMIYDDAICCIINDTPLHGGTIDENLRRRWDTQRLTKMPKNGVGQVRLALAFLSSTRKRKSRRGAFASSERWALRRTLGRKANKQACKAFSTAKKTSHPPCSLLDLAQNPFLRFASLTSAIEFLPFLFLRGNKALPNRKLFLLLRRPFFLDIECRFIYVSAFCLMAATVVNREQFGLQ